MKTVNITILLIILCTSAFSQVTTQREYNYMKEGYKEVESKGQDVIKGYTVEELQKYNAGDVAITFTVLRRENGSLAGTIVKTVSNEAFGSGTNYYVIPAPESDSARDKSFGWDNFYADLNRMSVGMQQHLLRWLTERFSSDLLLYKKRK